jgi:hypothetical protein
MDQIRVAILGAGGLGKAAAQIIKCKSDLVLVAIVDSKGIAFCKEGLEVNSIDSIIASSEKEGTVGKTPVFGIESVDPIGEIIDKSEVIDGIFIALPNLPNEFIPGVVERFARLGFEGVMVDALKRSRAVELMFKIDPVLKASKVTYITGAGATPGLLTAAAALASQSFIEILKVEIYFGVGISNWEAYRATIREDIAHLPGFDIEKASKMTEAQIEMELERRNGILELQNMEHADDVILERAGVVSRDRVTVGGVVDTRRPKKPVSTNIKITGRTFEGKISTHTLTLGDETSMAANVCGPAFGYLKTGIWLHQHEIYGVFTSAELMPKFVN